MKIRVSTADFRSEIRVQNLRMTMQEFTPLYINVRRSMKILFWWRFLRCCWRKQKGKEKLKKKYHGNYFDEEKEMVKNVKTSLKRTRKRNTCTGSNESEYENKKE